jgi:hypothetical protein
MNRLLMIVFAFVTVLLAQSAIAQETPECPEGYVCTYSGTDSNITSQGNMTTTIKQPPPSAISPQFSSGNNNDLCTIGVAGAVQTQILGISAGGTFTEENCKRLKNAKVLYDMGMKVAAVSVMCQDKNVFDAMMQAGTPCPYDGQIGEAAKLGWETHSEKVDEETGETNVKEKIKDGAPWAGLGILAFLLFI